MLDALGIKYETDKSSLHHDYCKVYEQYFNSLKNENIVLVELGIGGYEYEDRGGQSLRMWNEYFPNAQIHGIDIFPKKLEISDRVKLYCTANASEIVKDLSPDIIIDDGSHINAETIANFHALFPFLKSSGYYIAEDLHCSYWSEWFSGNEVPGADGTAMRFFTDLTHQLNHDTLLPGYKNQYSGAIEFVHFYKEMVIIKKK